MQNEQEDKQFTIDELRVVVRNSQLCNGLARGLHECVKTIDRSQGHLCILNAGLSEDNYKRVIKALCAKRNVPIVYVNSNMVLGEMVGLARLKPDGTPAKIVKCSCAVIREWGIESEARQAVSKGISASTEIFL
uniref:40S ribosomal protein S12 n=2 Tax=Lygus hesperus TaxID=30085 RepID=A0A0A9WCT3_LYGHE